MSNQPSGTSSLSSLLKLQLKDAVIDTEECKNLGIDVENTFKFRFNNLEEYLSERVTQDSAHRSNENHVQ